MRPSIACGGMDDVCIGLMNVLSVFHQSFRPYFLDA